MERTPLSKRKLPNYTRDEEVFNMVSHITGGGLAVIATVLCLVVSILHANPYAIISSAIYGMSMIVLYTMSSIYHGLRPALLGKRVFQVIDHCSVFLLIAGTYTPYCLVTLRSASPALGWTYFGIVWGLTILGVVLNSIDLKKFEIFSNICYLALGWCIITRIRTIFITLGPIGFALLVAGGVAYTVGAILYMNGKKRRYMHSVFHLFVLLGTILQFFSILFFVL